MIGTGVTLDVYDEDAVGELEVEVQVWAEIDDAGISTRLGGSSSHDFLPPDVEPTTTLMAAAHEQRELNLGNLMRELSDDDITRWELYAAPFRVELSPALQERLAGRWSPRDPA